LSHNLGANCVDAGKGFLLARASGDLPPHFQFMQLISVHLGVFIKLGLQRLART
jgi:hypothetical protein